VVPEHVAVSAVINGVSESACVGWYSDCKNMGCKDNKNVEYFAHMCDCKLLKVDSTY
jgi:hypothetical protein